jgi:hypothetical protein
MGSMSNTRKEIAERLGFAADATRSGAKAKFATEVGRKGNKVAKISRDPNGGWKAWVVQRGSTGVDEFEDVLGNIRSYSTEEKAKRAVIAALETSGFSRPGAKAKMAWNEATSNFNEILNDAIRIIRDRPKDKAGSAKLLANASEMAQRGAFLNEGSIASTVSRAIIALRNGNEQQAIELIKDAQHKAFYLFSRPGAKAAMGRAEQVMRDGSVHLDFRAAKEWLSAASEAELRYIVKDARAAASANPDGKKWNYYHDLAITASEMLAKRMKASRPGAKAKFAIDLRKAVQNLTDAWMDYRHTDNTATAVERAAAALYASPYDRQAKEIVEDMKHLRQFHGDGVTSMDTMQDITDRIKSIRNKLRLSRPGAKAK